MNTKNITRTLFATLLLSTAMGAAKAEAPYPADTTFVSTKTRADVVAELQQARAAGQLLVSDRDQDVKAVASSRTRDEVRAELAQARANGELAISNQ
ncbi:hypothetical protein GWL_42150 [Herbaspirillum sp. GW103]|jgi:hypothetical protein|uniref:DUF4148 domain-containing protein n=1 Tax=unclassified Herbaspirillum TaxID=2624150 RepID=UPI00025E35FC|nr:MULTISPECIES: DUF4148 domain-containing protein [unclassified Herbaspirillum]EIJ44776.1 hypothetical protein GWL_42150 [Herbaspirillum sp. GW103]MCI1006468.1 DUF4148 domain-containing protein [Herbaspirillum sp. C7C8]NUT62846.1 DUF4148 domain-containing protein [Herbaspirillum sp. C9C3]